MPPFSGMRCLVVDDEPRLRRVLVRLLEGEGFACAEAGSGVEALQELAKGPVPLVISDLRMPEMDGVTLLREIITRWPETAVIVVTAVAEVESAVACLQMGALDYVAKPFHLDEVRARVSQALDKRRLIVENRTYQQNLEQRVEAQARRIEELFLEGVHALEKQLFDAPSLRFDALLEILLVGAVFDDEPPLVERLRDPRPDLIQVKRLRDIIERAHLQASDG